jgi:hypothetical protein
MGQSAPYIPDDAAVLALYAYGFCVHADVCFL